MAQFNLALTPDKALKLLLDGNANFANGHTVRAQVGMCERRKKELLSGQNPFAIIICCSDSRITPQYMFDRELGELFVIRVAGNVMDSLIIGSVEYAIEQFNTPLVLVLGHQNCGAVQAALKGGATGSGHISAILDKIMPSIERVKQRNKDGLHVYDEVIRENALEASAELRQKSALVRRKVEQGDLKVVSGVFNLLTARVELVSEAAEAGHHHVNPSTPVCHQKEDEKKFRCCPCH